MNISKLSIGDHAPKIINCVIEIQKGSKNKYEYDDEIDVLMLDRIIHSSVVYPANYGFIPQTFADDGDHLDILIIADDSLLPGSVVKARPIGVLNMTDDNGTDYKIIAVIDNDPKYDGYKDITDINEAFQKEIIHFFQVYKELEMKRVAVHGYLPVQEAYKIILASQKK
jgi:inorganic pyrophosphatase